MPRLTRWLAFCVLLCCGATPLLAAEPARELPAGKTIQGTMSIGGKKYSLKHAVAYEAIVFDEPRVAILVSDTEIPLEKLKAALKKGQGSDDGFIFFKPNVRITFDKEGEIGFCNAWANNSSVSVSGTNLTGKLTLAEGRVRGTASLTDDEEDAKRRSTFDCQFDLPLLTGFVVPAKEKPPVPKAEEDEDQPEVKPTISIYSLPMPADASDAKYKALVEMMDYKSKTEYKALAKFLTKALEKQGWKKNGTELVGVSAIIKRKQGTAELTIFVKPVPGGSTVSIMSKGLLWEKEE